LLQFEYQQGKLEAAVEDLSWKVQKAEITDRGVSRMINTWHSFTPDMHSFRLLE